MSKREEWLDEIRAAVGRRIAAADATPDFLDVVARARTIDPEVELTNELEAAKEPAPEAANGPAAAGSAPLMDEWIGDVRAAMERRLDARRSGPIPVLAVRRERRAAWWIAGAALAAGIVVVLGAMLVVRTVAMDSAVPPEQALHRSDRLDPAGETAEQRPTPTSPAPARAVIEDEVAATSKAVEPDASEPEASKPEASKRPASAPGAGPARSPSLAEELAALAEEAQSHWRAGRREEAQRLFARIVARGGRSRAAEMAFADLFTLAHQQGDAGAQLRWWKAYLRRFPTGRFADDARAGSCRRESRDGQGACWADYLEDFPRGSFREEARAAVEDSG